jgi:hypothetical protein
LSAGKFRRIRLAESRKPETLANVVNFDVGIIGEDLLLARAACKHPEHRCNRDTKTLDAKDTTHLVGIDRDAIEVGDLYVLASLHYLRSRYSE